MTRRVPEWIADHPDQKIPQRVRVRVFNAYNGVCALSGRKIQVGDKWECDHKRALINGGEHRESNLQPVLSSEHKAKTRADVKAKADAYRIRSKHIGAVESEPSKLKKYPPSKRWPQGRVELRATGEIVWPKLTGEVVEG